MELVFFLWGPFTNKRGQRGKLEIGRKEQYTAFDRYASEV